MSLLAQQLSALPEAVKPLEDWVFDQLEDGQAGVAELKERCNRAGVTHDDIRRAAEACVASGRLCAEQDPDHRKEWLYRRRATAAKRADATDIDRVDRHAAQIDNERTRVRVLAVIYQATLLSNRGATAREVSTAVGIDPHEVSQAISVLMRKRRHIESLPALTGNHLRYRVRDDAAALDAARTAADLCATDIRNNPAEAPEFALESTGALLITTPRQRLVLMPEQARALLAFTDRVRPAIEAAHTSGALTA